MTREKKKLTYQDLEDHTIYWATDRLDELKQLSDKIYNDVSIMDEEKEFIYNGLAHQVEDLVELISPLRHDEEHLLLWATDFIDEYATYNKNSLEG